MNSLVRMTCYKQGWIQRSISGVGYAVPRDNILVPQPAIITFLSEVRGKSGLKLLKRPAAGYFLKIAYFQAIFKHFRYFLGSYNPLWVGLRGL